MLVDSLGTKADANEPFVLHSSILNTNIQCLMLSSTVLAVGAIASD